MTNELAIVDPVFDNAERALAEAQDLADVVKVRDQAEAIRLLMARQRHGLAWQNRAAEIKLRAERKAGEILAEMPRAQPGRQPEEKASHRETFSAAINDVGIPRATAARFQEVASIPTPVFEDHIEHTKQAEGELTTAGMLRTAKLAPMMSSETPEWYTPSHIIERVFRVLGDIDLDPCADPEKSIAARDHYTKADDGLSQGWYGRVYMNPPYGDEIAQWVQKLVAEFASGHCTQAIVLVPARLDTQWWKPLAWFPWCGVEGRLRFSGAANSAPFPSAVFYLGENVDSFASEFGDLGPMYRRFA